MAPAVAEFFNFSAGELIGRLNKFDPVLRVIDGGCPITVTAHRNRHKLTHLCQQERGLFQMT